MHVRIMHVRVSHRVHRAARQAVARLTGAAVAAGCAASGGAVGDARPVAPPGVSLDARVTPYAVEGRTVQEVRASMAREAPGATGDARFHGWHEYAIAWHWAAATPTPTGCVLRDPRVTVKSAIVVPRWTERADAEPGLAERWAAYEAALRAHERGHERLAVSAAGDLARTLRALRPASCAGAALEADLAGRRVLLALRDEEQRYDADTGHGRTQGAVWPPTAVPNDGAVARPLSATTLPRTGRSL